MRAAGSALSALLLALALATCHKSAEQEAEEAAKASAEADRMERRAFEELERGQTSEAARALVASQEAKEKAAKEQADANRATTRERDRYRALLTKEIAWLDRRITKMSNDASKSKGAVREEKEADIAAAREWRERLKLDLEAIDRPPAGAGWPDVKHRIDRDLDEDRPLSVPRSFEKEYGI